MDTDQQFLVENIGYKKPYSLHASFSHVEEPASPYSKSNKDAFNSIYKQFYPYAFFIARQFACPEDAGDIIASVFSKLWLHMNRLEKVENIKAYIRTCVRNACMDHRLKESTRSREDEIYAVHYLYSEESELYREARAEKLHRINLQIEKLPLRCQEVFKLAYVEGLNNSEIASQLGITNRTVRNQKTHALKMLRLALLSFLAILYTGFYLA
jgi:RNA polymerase sigma-70 factor (ECF subfamily)